MNNNTVSVYLGHPIHDPTERRALGQLRRALAGRGPSLILANFYAGPRQRQIDFLIANPHRTVHCELKGYRCPVITHPNGPWQLRLQDGSLRALDGNAYDQARQGTYAISDAIAQMLRGTVSRPAFRNVDTVVCLYPEIPSGSQITRFPHVEVIGFPDLLQRLQTPGPAIPWTTSQWEDIIRHLGLFPAEHLSPAHRSLEARRALLDDYRRRFLASITLDLPPLAPLPVEIDGRRAEALPLLDLAQAGRWIRLIGPSGAGKSHLARHGSAELTRRGDLVVWCRAHEYVAGRHALLLAQAIAPYTTSSWADLLTAAADAGANLTVVLDGLNECPPGLQQELLGQLHALQLREQVLTITTSQHLTDVPGDLPPLTVRLLPPDAPARARILALYGAPGRDDLVDAFSSPHELAIAAGCLAALPANPSAAALYDAYLRQRLPSHAARVGLRALARLSWEALRISLPTGSALRTLERAPTLAGAPAVLDEVLAAPIVRVRQGSISFVHEQFARFLAAEDLNVRANSGEDLADLLSRPRHTDLRSFALALEPEPGHVRDALVRLGDPDLTLQALTGKLGDVAQGVAHSEVGAALAEAQLAHAQPVDLATAPDGTPGLVAWTVDPEPTPAQRSLYRAAGRALARGLFIDDVGRLLDRTDSLCERWALHLRERGARTPRALLAAATYGLPLGSMLPASIVVEECEHGAPFRSVAPDLPAAIAPDPEASGWGRLFCALHLLSHSYPIDEAFLLRLLPAAWAAGVGHLRLIALQTARQAGYSQLSEETRQALIDWLNGLHPTGWALETSTLEALAALGGISDPIRSEEAILADIAEVLRSDDSDSDQRALTVVTSQFDEAAIVGPYDDAIASLPRTTSTQLLTKALRALNLESFYAPWVIEQAERQDCADPALADALRHVASRLPQLQGGGLTQSVVAAHVAAVAACATAHPAPPTVEMPGASPATVEAWRHMDVILFSLGCGTPPGDTSEAWSALTGRLWPETPVMLAALEQAAIVLRRDRSGQLYSQLILAFPTQTREVLQRALLHFDAVPRTLWPDPAELRRYIVRTLASVGNDATAELLRRYADDTEIGGAVVEVIRRIETKGGNNQEVG